MRGYKSVALNIFTMAFNHHHYLGMLNCFPQMLHHLTLPRAKYKGWKCSPNSPTLTVFLRLAIGIKCYLLVFDFYFPSTLWWWCMCLLVFCTSSLLKCLCKSYAHFLSGLDFFLLLSITWFFVVAVILGPHPWDMEVPRLGV